MVKSIAIFASGTGSNAKKIVDYFQDKEDVEIALIISNRARAPVLDMAESNQIDRIVLDRDSFYGTTHLLEELDRRGVDLLVLAGFLWLVPPYLVRAYEGRIINIHPALLPRYGGKGMYGMHVHRAVRKAGDTESGITIHYVNEKYDDGAIIFQARCQVGEEDSPEDIAAKVQKLEHRYFVPVIERLLYGLPMNSLKTLAG